MADLQISMDRQRAWTWHGQSSATALELEDRPMPVVGPHDMLVRNKVIGLNPVDWKVLRGLPDWEDRHVPGVDGAGLVVAVGAMTSKDWIGRRVVYHQSLNHDGSFAEYTAVAARALMTVPDGMGLSQAASLPCPALTAWLALDKLPARPGARLLVSGAGGAVGNYLVQMALQQGFIVTSMSNSRHWDRLRKLGVHATARGPLQSTDDLPGESIGQYLAVVDTVSGDHARRLAPALEANGHMVCVQDRLQTWPCEPFGRCLSLHEVALGALHTFGTDQSWARLVAAGEAMMKQIQEGTLQPEPLVIRDFLALPQFLDDLRQRNFSGKPLITVA